MQALLLCHAWQHVAVSHELHVSSWFLSTAVSLSFPAVNHNSSDCYGHLGKHLQLYFADRLCHALQIYERNEMFRQQVGNLQLIVGVYNNVQATILPVEKPLITQKLEAVDSALKKGLQVC